MSHKKRKAKPKAILASKLFLPEQLVKDKFLDWFFYDWVDIEWEPVEDEYGNPILKANGEPKVKRVKVERSLSTLKKIWTVDGAWIGLPRGDFGKLLPWLRKHSRQYEDLRVLAPLGYPLRLKKKTKKHKLWKAGQKQCIKEWMQHGFGIVKGDTGSGKTIIGSGLICELNMRTIILTKRKDGNDHWIRQLRKLTNIDKLEHKYDTEIVGAYTAKKRRFFPITVATVQTLRTKKGFKDLIAHQDYFGLIIGDECHELVTKKYRDIPASFNAAAIAGLTATDEREDKLHFMEYDLFGPVVTQNKGKPLDLDVLFVHTGVSAPGWIYKRKVHPGVQWNACMKALFVARRYDIIEHFMIKDIDNGLRVAAISPQRTEVVKELAKRLRHAGYKVAYVDGNVKKGRDKIYADFDAGKYHALCAGKVMNALVDIQSLNCIHMVTPLSNHNATRQVYGRAREMDAVIRDYADQGGQLSGSFRSRLRFCENNGWRVKEVDMRNWNDGIVTSGMSTWKRKGS